MERVLRCNIQEFLIKKISYQKNKHHTEKSVKKTE